MWKTEINVHNWENLGYSELAISVCLDQVSMHICARYEDSTIILRGRKGNCSKNEKWLPFKNMTQYFMCICMKEMKIPWLSLWPGGLSTDDNNAR